MENSNLFYQRSKNGLDNTAAVQQFASFKQQLQYMLKYILETGKEGKLPQIVKDIRYYLELIAEQTLLRGFSVDLIQSFISNIYAMDREVVIPARWLLTNTTPHLEVRVNYTREYSPEKTTRFNRWKESTNSDEVNWKSASGNSRPPDYDISQFFERRQPKQAQGASHSAEKRPGRDYIPEWLRDLSERETPPAFTRRPNVPSSTYVPSTQDNTSDDREIPSNAGFQDAQNHHKESASHQQKESSLYSDAIPNSGPSQSTQGAQNQTPAQPNTNIGHQYNYYGTSLPVATQPSQNQFYLPGQPQQPFGVLPYLPFPVQQPCQNFIFLPPAYPFGASFPVQPTPAQPSNPPVQTQNQFYFPASAQPFGASFPVQLPSPQTPAQPSIPPIQNQYYFPAPAQPFGAACPVTPPPPPSQVPVQPSNPPLQTACRSRAPFMARVPHPVSRLLRPTQLMSPEYMPRPSASVSIPVVSEPTISPAETPTPSTSNCKIAENEKNEQFHKKTQKEKADANPNQVEPNEEELTDNQQAMVANEEEIQAVNETQNDSVIILDSEQTGRYERELTLMPTQAISQIQDDIIENNFETQEQMNEVQCQERNVTRDDYILTSNLEGSGITQREETQTTAQIPVDMIENQEETELQVDNISTSTETQVAVTQDEHESPNFVAIRNLTEIQEEIGPASTNAVLIENPKDAALNVPEHPAEMEIHDDSNVYQLQNEVAVTLAQHQGESGSPTELNQFQQETSEGVQQLATENVEKGINSDEITPDPTSSALCSISQSGDNEMPSTSSNLPSTSAQNDNVATIPPKRKRRVAIPEALPLKYNLRETSQRKNRAKNVLAEEAKSLRKKLKSVNKTPNFEEALKAAQDREKMRQKGLELFRPKKGTIISGINDIVVRSTLCKIKLESDSISPQFKQEPVEPFQFDCDFGPPQDEDAEERENEEEMEAERTPGTGEPAQEVAWERAAIQDRVVEEEGENELLVANVISLQADECNKNSGINRRKSI